MPYDGPHLPRLDASPGSTLAGSCRMTEVLRYMGHPGPDVDGALRGRIARIMDECVSASAPRGTWSAFDLDWDGDAPRVAGTGVFLAGGDIATCLEGARGVVLGAVTLGVANERFLARKAANDALDQLIADASSSEFIQRCADALEADVMAWAARRGLTTGFPYAPGYGDLPLATQPELLKALGAAKLIGLGLTSSNMLLPMKSITVIIGLWDGPHPDHHPGCGSCDLGDFCQLRAQGITCRSLKEGYGR